jgi:ABC-2 type transport system ATP-binding protein
MNANLNIFGLQKKFGSKLVLEDIQMELLPGRIAGLMGPNGAGKTTILKTIVQFYKPDAGNIIMNEIPMNCNSRQEIAFKPDQNHLFKWMHVQDAIRYHQDMFLNFDRQKANELCESLKIHQNDLISTLPRGAVERVLIMLTFSRKAKIYLLDEPLGGIDPLSRQKILQAVLESMNEDSSVLIATHLVNEVEAILDDVFFLQEGHLLVADTAENIRAQHSKSIMEYYLEVFENA